MRGHAGLAGAALCLAVAGLTSASGCARSSIDAERSDFIAPAGIAARATARTRLSLAEEQARRELSLTSGAASRPTASRGPSHEAYRRWLRGEARSFSGPGGSAEGGK
ncbi:MAG: hypothetical protein OXU75_13975 [Deltaproteobacteria bacterium]|nr:hypothetical protein [Deltaproteobacteria bacterium]